MAGIVLATQNAKYVHTAFGLRYLLAHLGALRERTTLLEFDIKRAPAAVADEILSREPAIVGLGVYVWNVIPSTEVVRLLKDRRPGLVVILGGPEVGFETEEQEICRLADFVIAGEGDLEFARLCERLLAGDRPAGRILRAEPVSPDRLALPYDLYSDDDLAHRTIYVETSRGCPYLCEYCLSAGDAPVRSLDLARVLPELQKLMDRGARQFKFTDRTFNADIGRCIAVLRFFLERPGPFLHFEMLPDRFPPALRDVVRQFPGGAVQFEIGIQTFNPDVAARIRRKQDSGEAERNLRFLREHTGAILHTDLIAGLPGETFESFAAGFDRLLALRPHRIQVGILKRLRGAPIARHDGEWGMVYAAMPPYEILENRLIDRQTMDRVKRFARYWEHLYNRGDFLETAPLIWQGEPSPFTAFARWTDWAWARFGRDHSIPLLDLAQALFEYLTDVRGADRADTAEAMLRDYQRPGRRERPGFLELDSIRGRR